MARPYIGANILLLIRDRKANDIVSLCKELKLSGSSYYVEAKVKELTSAGLIVAVGNGSYEVADNWGKIQSALLAAPVLPVGYVVNASRIADRRMILAGYRLSDFLTPLLGN